MSWRGRASRRGGGRRGVAGRGQRPSTHSSGPARLVKSRAQGRGFSVCDGKGCFADEARLGGLAETRIPPTWHPPRLSPCPWFPDPCAHSSCALLLLLAPTKILKMPHS